MQATKASRGEFLRYAFTRPVSGTGAMTGELTPQGSVEPICTPYANRYDLALEPEVTEELTITWVATLDEVIKIALAGEKSRIARFHRQIPYLPLPLVLFLIICTIRNR